MSERSNANGEFTSTGLRPGSYRVLAVAENHVPSGYEQRFLGGPSATIDLHDRETAVANFELQPSVRITGVVVDHRGRPVPGVRVIAMNEAFADGRRQLRQVATTPPDVRTSPDGLFELGGLEPGEYYVSATAGGAFYDERVSKRRLAHAPTFVPDVVDPTVAKPVYATSAGATVRIQLQPVPLIRLRGKVVDSAGNPPVKGMVHLVANDSLVPSVKTMPTQPDGSFDLQALAIEGDYSLTGSSNTNPDQPNAEAGTISLAIMSEDVEGLRIQMSRGQTVRGIVVSSDRTPVPGIRVRAVPVNSKFGWKGATSAPTDEQGRFQVLGVVEPVVLLAEGEPWLTTQVSRNGVDVTTSGAASETSTSLATVTITRRLSKIGGRVIGHDPASRESLVAMAFSTDPEKWLDPAGRYARVSAVLRDSTYSFAGLPPGDYFVALSTGVGPATAADPARLTKLIANAVRVQLSSGQAATRDLEWRGGLE